MEDRNRKLPLVEMTKVLHRWAIPRQTMSVYLNGQNASQYPPEQLLLLSASLFSYLDLMTRWPLVLLKQPCLISMGPPNNIPTGPERSGAHLYQRESFLPMKMFTTILAWSLVLIGSLVMWIISFGVAYPNCLPQQVHLRRRSCSWTFKCKEQ